MRYSIKAYLKFLKNSTNQYGIHSPFVYDLVTKCFYDKKHYDAYKVLKQFRKELSNNSKTINVSDFGSGSIIFKSTNRVVSHIAKISGTTSKRAKLLFKLMNYFQPKQVLELGTSLGLGTSSMSLGNKQAKITTIEGCAETAKIAKEQFDLFQLNNIDSKIGTFNTVLSELKRNKYDLVYFDGNHQKEATLNYFEKLLPCATNNSIFIFDDIHWSKDMTEAWEKIIKYQKVTVSIDTFFWGVVFFRKEQAKEHFTIRI